MEANKVAVEATDRGMHEAKKKLDAATPAGGSKVEALRTLFEGEPKRMRSTLTQRTLGAARRRRRAAVGHGRERPCTGPGVPVVDPIMTLTSL